MFNNHKFIILITGEWVIDMNDFTGYKVKFKNGVIESYEVAFKASLSSDNKKVYFTKYMNVPVKILNEASLQMLSNVKGIKGIENIELEELEELSVT